VQTNLNDEAVRDLMAMGLQRTIAYLAAAGIKTDSSNVLLNIGKSY